VVEGLKRLGLDPANVEYVLLGHGHADHFGGAAHLQQRYGARVATTAADWDLIHPPGRPADPARPTRDLVISEREPLTVGDVTVTIVEIPGHTAGSLAYIFPVREGGQTRMAGLFGGTILLVDRIPTPGLKQYVASIAHYLDVARRMKVEVAVQNHPIFDRSPERFAALKTRGAGAPHPFQVTTDSYATFWGIISECIQAEIARRDG
jgi:metallo-beta-lactamase class B